MDNELDRLYTLLPAIYRQRDIEQGRPLQALLRVITEQVNAVKADIDRLYANWFIETCDDWVVPYIAELIGYRPVHDAGAPGEIINEEGRLRNKILIPRREVANTLRYRRRKGTLSLLEDLGRDVTGWTSVHAVEFYRLLAWFQAMNNIRRNRGGTVDLRHSYQLKQLAGPFDTIAHTVDVRAINSQHTPGRYNIPDVALFIWRLQSYSFTHVRAYNIEEDRPNRYTFSILGNQTPLYNRPAPTAVEEEIRYPHPLSLRAFDRDLNAPESAYYGEGKSLTIWAPHWPKRGSNVDSPLPASCLIAADLSDWSYVPRRNSGRVAVDPEHGLIAFPSGQQPRHGVWVMYYTGFPADIGGGEYRRPLSQHPQAVVYPVTVSTSTPTSFNDALQQWNDDQPDHAIIEIKENMVISQGLLEITLRENQTLQIRTAQGYRAVLRLLDFNSDESDALHVSLAPGSCFILDGMLIMGRGLVIDKAESVTGASTPAHLIIRHSTLVPGWSLEQNCHPRHSERASLEVNDVNVAIRITHCIVGSILINQSDPTFDPIPLHVCDSIVDATSDDEMAISSDGDLPADALVTIVRSTVNGKVSVREIDMAENSIFTGSVRVRRHQHGCIRFCYVPPISRTPRRYQCQPDLVKAAVRGKLSGITGTPPSPSEIQALEDIETDRVRVQFTSTRYGTPAYCQLADTCADEIKQGADDQSEMGVYHDLFQPQREANLRARLDEYTPSADHAAIIFIN